MYLLEAGAWVNGEPQQVDKRLINIILNNKTILNKILKSAKADYNKSIKKAQDPIHLIRLIKALTSQGLIDFTSKDILKFSGNINKAFDIGTLAYEIEPNHLQEIVKQSTNASVRNDLRKMDKDIQKQISKILVVGQNKNTPIKEMVTQIHGRFKVAEPRANTLVRTTVMRTSNTASYSQSRIEGAKCFVVDHRPACCIKCRNLYHGKIFDITEAKYIPPIHPNCACTPLYYYSKREARAMGKDIINRNVEVRKIMEERGLEIPESGSGVNINLSKPLKPTAVI